MATAETILVVGDKIYLSLAWMKKIPVSPFDSQLSERLLSEISSSPPSESILINRNGQAYVSLRHLNFLLATSTPPRLARTTLKEDDDGCQFIGFRLSDMKGMSVPLVMEGAGASAAGGIQTK